MPCRTAQMEDARAISRVHVLGWRAAYAGIMPASFLDQLEEHSREDQWRRILETSSRSTLVFESDSTVVGFCSFGPSRDDDAMHAQGEIYSLYILPSDWRKGVGRALLTAACAELRSRGLTSPTLWVASSNDPARRFYERLGFRIEGRTRVETLREDISVAETRYIDSAGPE